MKNKPKRLKKRESCRIFGEPLRYARNLLPDKKYVEFLDNLLLLNELSSEIEESPSFEEFLRLTPSNFTLEWNDESEEELKLLKRLKSNPFNEWFMISEKTQKIVLSSTMASEYIWNMVSNDIDSIRKQDQDFSDKICLSKLMRKCTTKFSKCTGLCKFLRRPATTRKIPPEKNDVNIDEDQEAPPNFIYLCHKAFVRYGRQILAEMQQHFSGIQSDYIVLQLYIIWKNVVERDLSFERCKTRRFNGFVRLRAKILAKIDEFEHNEWITWTSAKRVNESAIWDRGKDEREHGIVLSHELYASLISILKFFPYSINKPMTWRRLCCYHFNGNAKFFSFFADHLEQQKKSSKNPRHTFVLNIFERLKKNRYFLLEISKKVDNDDQEDEDEEIWGPIDTNYLCSKIDCDYVIIDRLAEKEFISETMAEELVWTFIPFSIAVESGTYLKNFAAFLNKYLRMYYRGFARRCVDAAVENLHKNFTKNFPQSIIAADNAQQNDDESSSSYVFHCGLEMERMREEYFRTKSKNMHDFLKFIHIKYELFDGIFGSKANSDQNDQEPTMDMDQSIEGQDQAPAQPDCVALKIRNFICNHNTKTKWTRYHEFLVNIDHDFLQIRHFLMYPGNLLNGLRYILYRRPCPSERSHMNMHKEWIWSVIWQLGLRLLNEDHPMIDHQNRRIQDIVDRQQITGTTNPDVSQVVQFYVSKLFNWFELNLSYARYRKFVRTKFFDVLTEILATAPTLSSSSPSESTLSSLSSSSFCNNWDILERIICAKNLRILAGGYRYVIEFYIAFGEYFKKSYCQNLAPDRRNLLENLWKNYQNLKPITGSSIGGLLELCIKLAFSDKSLRYEFRAEFELELLDRLKSEPDDTLAFELLFEYFPHNSSIPDLLCHNMSHEYVLEFCRRFVEKNDTGNHRTSQLIKILTNFLDIWHNRNNIQAWRLLDTLIDRMFEADQEEARTLLVELWASRSDWWNDFHLPKLYPTFYTNATTSIINKSFDDYDAQLLILKKMVISKFSEELLEEMVEI